MQKLYEWLLNGEAWVQYRTRIDLLGEGTNESEVIRAHQAMLDHPTIKAIIEELTTWPGPVITNHKNASHPIQKLSFLAELGLTRNDPHIEEIAAQIFKHQSQAGPFQVLVNIPKAFGGTGKDNLAWTLCDTPLILYALIKFGYGEDKRVQQAIEYLTGLVRDNGWSCAASPEIGKFHGPGRKDEPCPYANLIMLKALAQIQDLGDSPAACRKGAETQLFLWQNRRELHPYIFYMGTDFCKLKAPFVWYDLVHVLDVLSQFPWLSADPRIKEMLDILRSKGNAEGQFTPESIWTAWKDWDFGQKKEPSRWLTFLSLRIMKRLEGSLSVE
ncbi:MAG: hypothetical protein C4545_01450 [Anaerolineaceae bacterium]|nr:MAG: hypothetical protein C4545_01450 [Anaerolineaceae bacterium]